MKKSKVLLGTLLSSTVILSGCSKDGDKIQNNGSIQKTEESKKEDTQGTIIDRDGFRKVPVVTNNNLNISEETDVFKTTIYSLQISNISIKNQQILDSSNSISGQTKLETGKEYTAISLKVTIENKLNEDLNIAVSNSKLLIKENQQQIENNIIFSDIPSSSYLSKAKQDATLVFITDKIKADEIKNLTLRLNSPYLSNYSGNLEPLSINFEIK